MQSIQTRRIVMFLFIFLAAALFVLGMMILPETIITQFGRNVGEVSTMPKVYEDTLRRVPIFLLQSDWILRSFVDQAHTGEFYAFSKRLMDIVGGLIGLLLFLPLFPLITLAILIDNGFPVFFTQTRLGESGKEYRIIKFRTMVKDAEKDGKAQLAQLIEKSL